MSSVPKFPHKIPSNTMISLHHEILPIQNKFPVVVKRNKNFRQIKFIFVCYCFRSWLIFLEVGIKKVNECERFQIIDGLNQTTAMI